MSYEGGGAGKDSVGGGGVTVLACGISVLYIIILLTQFSLVRLPQNIHLNKF
jgi:hypothetical protein